MRNLLLLVWVALSSAAHAQFVVTAPTAGARPAGQGGGQAAVLDTVALPFFDDFAVTLPRLDSARWVPGGGAYANRHYGIDPPSLGVATLDGTDGSGTPYVPTDNPPQRRTDVLTSQPIDLSGTEAVFLSFFWQAGGRATELYPDNPNDSLVLEFKRSVDDSTDAWERVWFVTDQETAPFVEEIVAVSAPYLQSDFQFRFAAYGRPNGRFDVFHLDYIYLDANRSATDFQNPTNPQIAARTDYALSNGPARLLRRYAAMPANQLLASAENEFVESTNFTYNRLGQFLTLGLAVTIRETVDSTLVLLDSSPDITQNPGDPAFTQRLVEQPLDAAALRAAVTDSAVLEYEVAINNPNPINPVPPRLTANDTARQRIVLTDYYAYDDGTSEASAFVRGSFAQVACRFYLSEPDTLTHVSFGFARTLEVTSPPFELRVWKYLPTAFDDSLGLVHAQSAAVVYGTDTVGNFQNQFFEFRLDSALVLADSFYVGYLQQTTEDGQSIKLGYDLDVPLDDRYGYGYEHTFLNYDGLWRPLGSVTSTLGSLMIRPRFAVADTAIVKFVGRHAAPGGTAEAFGGRTGLYSPNPIAPGATLLLDPEVSALTLYNNLGVAVGSAQFKEGDPRRWQIPVLPSGFYVLYLTDPAGRVAVRRLVVAS